MLPVEIPTKNGVGVRRKSGKTGARGRIQFVIDFLNVFPPTGVATARIITSPGHVKRIIRALQENLRRYEERFGSIEEAPPPTSGPMGYA